MGCASGRKVPPWQPRLAPRPAPQMNNLSVYVASPLQRWLEALEALPGDRRAAAEAEAGPYLSALPEELPGCEGNAFYALHSCLNHRWDGRGAGANQGLGSVGVSWGLG